MKKIALNIVLAAFVALVFCSCIGTCPVMPPKTPIYSSFKAPLSTEFNKTELGPKVGRATCTSYLSLFTSGDVSIKTAAQEGGITKVNHADYEYENVFGFLYQKFTIVVYGE